MKAKKIISGTSASYKKVFLEGLKDPEEAIPLLNECLRNEEFIVFLLALQDVLEAQLGAITQEIDEELDKLGEMATGRNKTILRSFNSLLGLLDLQLSIRPKESAEKKVTKKREKILNKSRDQKNNALIIPVKRDGGESSRSIRFKKRRDD